MKMIENDSTKHIMLFDSAADWVDSVSARDFTNCHDTGDFYEYMQSDLSGCDWSGNKNGDENTRNILANKADADKVAKVHEADLGAIFNTTEYNEVEGLNIYNDEAGLILDSTAYFNGEEQCMLNVDITMPVKPIIYIACNIGGRSNIEPHQFINRGIALIRAVHALERAGVSVGLVGYSRSDRSTLQLIDVKKPQDSLNEQTLINVFADCSPFRTIGFAHRLLCNKPVGATQTLLKKHLKGTKYENLECVILGYDNMSQYHNTTRATEWTIEQIKKQTTVAL